MSTIRRARTSKYEKRRRKREKRGRPRKLDSKAEPEFVAWIKKYSLNSHDPTCSEVTDKVQELLDKEGKGVDLSRHAAL